MFCFTYDVFLFFPLVKGSIKILIKILFVGTMSFKLLMYFRKRKMKYDYIWDLYNTVSCKTCTFKFIFVHVCVYMTLLIDVYVQRLQT